MIKLVKFQMVNMGVNTDIYINTELITAVYGASDPSYTIIESGYENTACVTGSVETIVKMIQNCYR